MKNQLSSNWYIFLLKGIVLVILSIFVFVYPEDTLRTGVVLLGVFLFINGMFLFIRGINMKKGDHNWNLLMAEGLAYLISGFLMSVAPMLMAAIVPYLIGILAAIYGILIIAAGFRESLNRSIRLSAGIIILLLSCVLIFKPLLLGLTVVIWLGIILLGAGIFNIYLAIKLRENYITHSDLIK
jgi:uncharacterized membrane protein HdeD (DUF308 family)